MAHLKEGEPFGRVLADVSAIEFQKLGLVHAHIILFLHDNSKKELENPIRFDAIISAEIPSEGDFIF